MICPICHHSIQSQSSFTGESYFSCVSQLPQYHHFYFATENDFYFSIEFDNYSVMAGREITTTYEGDWFLLKSPYHADTPGEELIHISKFSLCQSLQLIDKFFRLKTFL